MSQTGCASKFQWKYHISIEISRTFYFWRFSKLHNNLSLTDKSDNALTIIYILHILKLCSSHVHSF